MSKYECKYCNEQFEEGDKEHIIKEEEDFINHAFDCLWNNVFSEVDE